MGFQWGLFIFFLFWKFSLFLALPLLYAKLGLGQLSRWILKPKINLYNYELDLQTSRKWAEVQIKRLSCTEFFLPFYQNFQHPHCIQSIYLDLWKWALCLLCMLWSGREGRERRRGASKCVCSWVCSISLLFKRKTICNPD